MGKSSGDTCMGHDPREFDDPDYDPNRLSDEHIDILIRIVDSEPKEYRRHWYSLGIAIPHGYSLDEQLEALEQLGRSRNPKALAYVEKLARTEDRGYVEGGSSSNADTSKIVYPHAHGSLAIALLSGEWAVCPSIRDNPDPSYPNSRAVSTLETALSQLKKDV